MSDGMPVEVRQMFTLLDRETVRLQLPALPMAGIAEPLRIHLDFDADCGRRDDRAADCAALRSAL